MHATRDEIVACPFWGRLCENGSLYFEEPTLVKESSCGLQKTVPERDVALKVGAPEVEMTVTQPEIFRGKLLTFSARNRDRGRVGDSENNERFSLKLHVSGGDLTVSHLLRPE
jgi:hypothetical protein